MFSEPMAPRTSSIRARRILLAMILAESVSAERIQVNAPVAPGWRVSSARM
jgi:hypothetical protein